MRDCGGEQKACSGPKCFDNRDLPLSEAILKFAPIIYLQTTCISTLTTNLLYEIITYLP